MKTYTGRVIANKQNKTITVEVERFFRHPLYERRMRRTKKYAVHTETQIELGATVKFVETRPISKNKRWRVVENAKVIHNVMQSSQSAKVQTEVKTKKGK